MRKTNAVYSIGAAALILSGAASAQIPELGINFGEVGIDAAAGACESATGGTCSTIAAGTGFIQRQIDVGGKSFIQTIISDSGFESEDFVQIGFGGSGSVQGIASKLSVTQDTYASDFSTSGFEANSIISAGWAATSGAVSNAVIEVNISEAGATDGFSAAFQVDTDYDGTDNTINSLIASQVATLGSATDKQVFYTEIKGADNAGSDTISGGGIGEATWAAGDQIQVVWVGQDMPAAQLSGFGAQSVTNLENGSSSSVSSLTDPGPFGTWNAEWSETPTF
ncbi:MAG: hypothetical protein GXP14_15285 [Gammaproteobacteria bacterium]|nr:hypothetical protein [Gammaproteobacteria bacterium]